jgi:hypothetical protein
MAGAERVLGEMYSNPRAIFPHAARHIFVRDQTSRLKNVTFQVSVKISGEMGIVVHTCNPSFWKS